MNNLIIQKIKNNLIPRKIIYNHICLSINFIKDYSFFILSLVQF